MESSWYPKQEQSSGGGNGTPPGIPQRWLVPAAVTAIVLFWAVAAWFAIGLVRALG